MPPELTTTLAVLERLGSPSGKDVLDVGCGGGALARELSARGARVTGLEISDGQLADARARGEGAGLRYVVGRAEDLPFADGSFDVVVFMNSLHHVPEDQLMAALAEARRVLAPDGMVCVTEPVADGDLYVMVKVVEDEDRVRAAAQAALAAAGQVGLERGPTLEYEVGNQIADLAALRRRIVSVDPARAARFDAHEAELAAAFAGLGSERDGGRWFTQPMQADVLRPTGHA